jgi:hypothetical protein
MPRRPAAPRGKLPRRLPMKGMRAWCAVLLLAGASMVHAQERPYKDGPVVEVTAVKLQDGQFENYMAYLAKNYRGVMEESKKAGFVLDYHVLVARPKSPDDADMYLVVMYPNMAALDDMEAKMDPITAKVTQMNYLQADEASGKRSVMRTILGSELLRELTFK